MSGDGNGDDSRHRTDALRRAFLTEVGLDANGGGGRALGQYLLIAPIGKGAAGTVWRALHRELAHEVAIKTLDDAEVGDPERLERFRREATTAAKLRHPGIVRVHDFGHEGGSWYLVMDLIEGRSLGEWVAHERPTLDRRLAIVEKIARAVDHAHRQGVVHRDLKPSNIMVRADDEPVLVDFGVARARGAAPLTRDGGVVGTLAFMAPEQLRGGHADDGRADLFALGVLLHWIATGALAFGDAPTPDSALAARQQAPAAPSTRDPTLPHSLDALVRRCLEPEPALRLASAAALADDLARIRRGEPILADATTWQRRAWRRLRPLRWRAAGAIVAVTLLAVGAWFGRELLLQRETLDSHAVLLATESALLDLSPRLRPLLERAEQARYQPLPEPQQRALQQQLEAQLDASNDTTGIADAYRAWSLFLLAPEQAADAFARAKVRHPDNPFVWLLSARRHLRRVADSPAWSATTPITYELLVEPLTAPAALQRHPAMKQVIADAREDLEQARRAAAIDNLPGLRWIGTLCDGVERFATGDAPGVIELLQACTSHDDIDFEATLFLCFALCNQHRVDEAIVHARRLRDAHPGIAPAIKLLALCLQLGARDQLDQGKSPVAELEEAARWFAGACSDSVVDAILTAQLDFDLKVARLIGGSTDADAWRANLELWRKVRQRVLAQDGVIDAAIGAAHARVGTASTNLALFALSGQASLDELHRAIADHAQAVALVPGAAWVRSQSVQARLAAIGLEVRWSAPARTDEITRIRTEIHELRALGEARAAADGTTLQQNPWATGQADLAEAQLRVSEAIATTERNPALADRLEQGAAMCRHAREIAPTIQTTEQHEFECTYRAMTTRPATLAELTTIVRRLPFEQLTGRRDFIARWIDPLLELAGAPRCQDREAVLALATEGCERMVNVAPDDPWRLALWVDVAIRRRWLEPERALDHVDAALARTGAAIARLPKDPVVAEAHALVLLTFAELGGREEKDAGQCVDEALAALVAAGTGTAAGHHTLPSARTLLLTARLRHERGDDEAAAAAMIALRTLRAADLPQNHLAATLLALVPAQAADADAAAAAAWQSLR
ncbi:MAG: serine/threonine protein kinase [Planctomycetes bacterium]|nr:serine/threonine protein kinase [Planctomycetota bacterium]